MLILESQQVEIPTKPPLDVYLVALGEAAEKELVKLLYELRVAGLRVDKDYQGRKMKAQMKSADRLQARYAAILGDDELARGEISLKNLSNWEQETVKLVDLNDVILHKLSGGTN